MTDKYGFEDPVMFHFVTGTLAGVFSTYDRGANVDVEQFIAICQAYL